MGGLALFIVNYNGFSLLGDLFFKCLDSFIAAAKGLGSVDIWFVDNGSRDSSVGEVRRRYGNRLGYIAISRNLGYGAACNIAYAYTKRLGLRYNYYVCSNNDIEVDRSSFGRLVRWLGILEDRHPRGFIASPILVNGYDGLVDFGGLFVDEAGSTWPLRLALLDAGKVGIVIREPLPVSFCDGAFHITHRNVIEDLGWFDPSLFLYYEDVELSLRAWSHGYPSLLIPVVLGKHYRMTTAGKARIRAAFFNSRNKVYYIARYMGRKSFLKLLLRNLSYPARILEIRSNPSLQNLMHTIVPGAVVYEPSNTTLLELSKYMAQAFLEGLALALRKRGRKKSRGGVKQSALLHMSFTDLLSQKRIIAKLQSQVKRRIVEALKHSGEGQTLK